MAHEQRLDDSDLEARYQASLARAARVCTALQERLLDLEAALRQAEERRSEDAAAAADHLARRHAEFTASVAEGSQQRDALAQQLSATMAALEQVRQDRLADATAAAAHLSSREAEMGAALSDAVAARTALDERFADAESTRERDRLRAAAELADARGRESALLGELERETALRAAAEQDLSDTRAELEQRLRQAEDQLHGLRGVLAEEREAHARAHARGEAEAGRLRAEIDRGQEAIGQMRAAFATLEQLAGEHALERARLDGTIAERDARLSDLTLRYGAAEQAVNEAVAAQEVAREALDRSEARHGLAVRASIAENARLQQEAARLQRELDEACDRAETLQREAARVPELHRQLAERQKETWRLFERAPHALCRCTPAGEIMHANSSLARLLGYRGVDDVKQLAFARVFDPPDDLPWLLQRAAASGRTESIETAWRTKDRRRLRVKLHALAVGDTVEMVVEDLTPLRSMEERVREAERLEAVGRLASEVAVTCDNLLRDVTSGGQQWLAAMGSDTPLRHQGEQLLGEVTRAAGFLRQFTTYGSVQMSSLDPVNVLRVLRDLEPVLKRLAGDDLELVLPKSSGSFDVDVEAGRLERILVNVVACARQRMPQGGRIRIDLATTTVDRTFAATHPNVRPGTHVLMTVTEVRGPIHPPLPEDARLESAASRPVSRGTGVDLGALLALIGQSGGHLWMAAEPSGETTLKIHLPGRVNEPVAEAAPVGRPERGRSLVRWFRH